MPRLVSGPPSQAAPSTYKLAPSEAFIPESVTATFDGAGAGGPFLPTLSIYSQDGKLIARSPATPVLAGSSAEVTFAPLLRAASAAAVSEAAFAIGGQDVDSVTSDAFFHNLAFDPFTLLTNDSSIFSIQTVAGRTGLVVSQVGSYMAWWTCQFADRAGFRVANPETFTVQADDAGGEVTFGMVLGTNQDTGLANPATGGATWQVLWGKPFAADAATVAAGTPICIQVNQQTGQTLDTLTSYYVHKLAASDFGF